MDNAQAKFILSAYRPDGRDATDPLFAEALEQARKDPDLQKWFEAERALDASMAAALKGVTPPPDLKAALLASGKMNRFPRRVAPAWWMAMAAALVLAAFITWQGMTPSFHRYEKELAAQIISGQAVKLALLNTNPQVLQGWLADHRVPIDLHLPGGIEKAPSIGCRTFTWQGRSVAQICFMTKEGHLVHLFVIREKNWRGAPPIGHPAFTQDQGWNLAHWRQGGQTYVLAESGPLTDLQKLFL